MIRYILLKIASTLPILIGVSVLVFVLMNVVPGDPIAIMQSRCLPAIQSRRSPLFL